PPGGSCSTTSASSLFPDGSAVSVVSESVELRRWKLGFGSFHSYHVVRALRGIVLHTFRRSPAFPICYFPVGLSPLSGSGGPEVFFLTSPASGGDQTSR